MKRPAAGAPTTSSPKKHNQPTRRGAPELHWPVESEQPGRPPIPVEENTTTIHVSKEREKPVAASNYAEIAVRSGGRPDAASRKALLVGKGQGTIKDDGAKESLEYPVHRSKL